MSFLNYIVKDLCFSNIQHKKRKQSILLLCCKGFPHIGKLANGSSYLKSPYNALQTLEHWECHVCLPIVSLKMHESFTDITLATNTKLATKKVALCSFLSKIPTWLLSLSCQMATQDFFFILGPWLWQFEPYPGAIMGFCHIIKQKSSSFLYLPNKILFRNRPIMHYVHCDILLALHVCTLESTLVRSPALGVCNSHTKPMSWYFYRTVYF